MYIIYCIILYIYIYHGHLEGLCRKNLNLWLWFYDSALCPTKYTHIFKNNYFFLRKDKPCAREMQTVPCHAMSVPPSWLNSWHRAKLMGKKLVWTCLKRSKHTIFGWNLQSQLFCCENQEVLTHSLIIPNISSVFDGTWGSNPFRIFPTSFPQLCSYSIAPAVANKETMDVAEHDLALGWSAWNGLFSAGGLWWSLVKV